MHAIEALSLLKRFGDLQAREVQKEGDKFRLFTEGPPAVLEGVMAYARDRSARVISVDTLGPSLEDVFIRLTGLDVRTREVTTVD